MPDYFSNLSLYIDTSSRQLIGYSALSLAFLVATMIVLTRLDELENLFGLGVTVKRGWLSERIPFVGIGILLGALIGGMSFALLRFYFYGRTIEIVSRSDYSSVLAISTYQQFFDYMVDRVTIPALDSELPMSRWWTIDRLTVFVHLVLGMAISVAMFEWRLRHQATRQAAISRELEELAEISKKNEARSQARTGREEKTAYDIYEAFYRRNHVCARCGKVFNTKEELEEHFKHCGG